MAADTSNGPSVWVLLDDRAGNRSQALGVAEALQRRTGWPFVEKFMAYRRLAGLPNVLLGASIAGIDAQSRQMLTGPWPDVVIAAGRRTAPVARWIKDQSRGQTKLVHIMDPGTGYDAFDVLVIPSHDSWSTRPGPGTLVLRVPAAPHRVVPSVLESAQGEWHSVFEPFPAPRIGLLVGGSTRKHRFTPDMAADLAATVRSWVSEAGGSVLMTTSRRTDRDADAALRAGLGETPLFHFGWGDTGANPYFGILACADHVIVTGESVSMCSEAVASGKPVSIYAPDPLMSPKHAKMVGELYRTGAAYPLSEGPDRPAGSRIFVADTIAEVVDKMFDNNHFHCSDSG